MLSQKIKQKQFKNIVHISTISSIISAIITGMGNTASLINLILGFLLGGTLGFIIPFLYIHLVTYLQTNPRVRRLPYRSYVLLNFLVFCIVVIITYFILAGIFFREYALSNFKFALAIAIILAMIFIFQDTITQFLGKSFLGDIFFGRYFIPKEQEMIVCFVDVKDSTKWAEVLGGKRFFALINDFLLTVEQCAAYYSGEIYKFLGDGIIIVWYNKKTEDYQNALDFMLELRAEMGDRQAYFTKNYGEELKYSLGIHEGKLIIGELGSNRKEIGYWGDTINTASRISNECRNHGDDMLISEQLFDKLLTNCKASMESINIQRIDDVLLRGKTNPMNLIRIKGNGI